MRLQKLRYAQHRANAKSRGIEFDLTFDEWWAIWEPRFNERGTKPDQYQMCRRRDEGGYSVGNVRIDTAKNNQTEAVESGRRKAIQRDWPNGGQSWLFDRGNPFMCYFKQRARQEKLAEAGLDEEDI